MLGRAYFVLYLSFNAVSLPSSRPTGPARCYFVGNLFIAFVAGILLETSICHSFRDFAHLILLSLPSDLYT